MRDGLEAIILAHDPISSLEVDLLPLLLLFAMLHEKSILQASVTLMALNPTDLPHLLDLLLDTRLGMIFLCDLLHGLLPPRRGTIFLHSDPALAYDLVMKI